MLYWSSGRFRRHQPLRMQSASFPFCHPERSLMAHAKDLVAPLKRIAPSTRTMSDADGRSRARACWKQHSVAMRFRDPSAALRSPQDDRKKRAFGPIAFAQNDIVSAINGGAA